MCTFSIQEFRDAFHLGSNLVKFLHSSPRNLHLWPVKSTQSISAEIGLSCPRPRKRLAKVPPGCIIQQNLISGKICPFFLAHMWICWVSPFFMLCFVCSPLPKALNNKSPELRLPREVKACQKQTKTPNCNVPQLVLVTFLWTTMQQGPTETNFKVKQISSSLPSSYAWHGTLPSQQLKKWTLRHRISK